MPADTTGDPPSPQPCHPLDIQKDLLPRGDDSNHIIAPTTAATATTGAEVISSCDDVSVDKGPGIPQPDTTTTPTTLIAVPVDHKTEIDEVDKPLQVSSHELGTKEDQVLNNGQPTFDPSSPPLAEQEASSLLATATHNSQTEIGFIVYSNSSNEASSSNAALLPSPIIPPSPAAALEEAAATSTSTSTTPTTTQAPLMTDTAPHFGDTTISKPLEGSRGDSDTAKVVDAVESPEQSALSSLLPLEDHANPHSAGKESIPDEEDQKQADVSDEKGQSYDSGAAQIDNGNGGGGGGGNSKPIGSDGAVEEIAFIQDEYAGTESIPLQSFPLMTQEEEEEWEPPMTPTPYPLQEQKEVVADMNNTTPGNDRQDDVVSGIGLGGGGEGGAVTEGDNNSGVQPQEEYDNSQALTVRSPWEESFDPDTGQIYYFNTVSGESRWDNPESALVTTSAGIGGGGEQWESLYDPISGQQYFYNSETNESKWPGDEEDAEEKGAGQPMGAAALSQGGSSGGSNSGGSGPSPSPYDYVPPPEVYSTPLKPPPAPEQEAWWSSYNNDAIEPYYPQADLSNDVQQLETLQAAAGQEIHVLQELQAQQSSLVEYLGRSVEDLRPVTEQVAIAQSQQQYVMAQLDEAVNNLHELARWVSSNYRRAWVGIELITYAAIYDHSCAH